MQDHMQQIEFLTRSFLTDIVFWFSGSSQPEASQVDGEREQPWAPSESGASDGPREDGEGEEDEEGLPNGVNGGDKGARWMWGAEQRRLRGQPLAAEEEEEEEEENNNSSTHQEEEEEAEERTEGGEEQGREEEEREEGEEEEEEDEEEMDQDSDDFEHSAESGREEEEEESSLSLRNSVSAPNNNEDSGCTRQSSSNKKVSKAICIEQFTLELLSSDESSSSVNCLNVCRIFFGAVSIIIKDVAATPEKLIVYVIYTSLCETVECVALAPTWSIFKMVAPSCGKRLLLQELNHLLGNNWILELHYIFGRTSKHC